MNFSVCFLGVSLLVLHNICEARVMVTYRVADEIEKVYAERKKDDRHLGHIASLTQGERLAACKFYRAGDYSDDEDSKPHMYEVKIPDGVIPEEKKDEAGLPETGPSNTTPKAKEPMDEETQDETGVEPEFEQLKVAEIEHEEGEVEKEREEMVQQERWELKKEDEKHIEPKMIYDQDIAFRCRTKNADEEDFILSYGFAQKMFFVSEPVGELDPEKPFSGRKMKLKGYMFAPPITERFTMDQLQIKYFQLRKRTEKARSKSPTLLEDIEKNDDISALTFQEKNILCASIMETQRYKNEGYLYVPIKDSEYFEYVKYPVGVFNSQTSEYVTFDTDFMRCKAKRKNSPVEIIGVTRSYAEGGDVFTSIIKDGLAEKQFLDAEVTKIAVLSNRKYAGPREGVLEVVFETITAK